MAIDDLRTGFDFSGVAYVRPCGRGVLLLEPGNFEVLDMPELDDSLQAGYYRVELRFVPIAEPLEASSDGG